MNEIVVDASAFLAVLLKEDLPDDLREAFGASPDLEMVVPPLWYWEVTNIAVVAVRRSGSSWSEMETQLADLLNLPIQIDHASMDNVTSTTARLAIGQNLTVYDAAYLELTIRRGIPLATLDRRLATAARSFGVEVIGAPEV